MLVRRSVVALVAAVSLFLVGCGDSDKPDPKPPAGVDAKPLAPPGAPGGGSPPAGKAVQPGAGAAAQ